MSTKKMMALIHLLLRNDYNFGASMTERPSRFFADK